METLADFLARDPAYQRANERLRAISERIHAGGDRWGDCRRFSGRMAGNRRKRLDSARAAWSRAYDGATKRFHKLHG